MLKDPKILYVDDEEDLVMLASSFFEDENLSLETCIDFDEAVRLVKTNKYDLIISDSRMPTGSGLELLNICRSENGFDGKFILVTGNVGKPPHKGEYDYDMILYKPIKFEELVKTVKEFLSV